MATAETTRAPPSGSGGCGGTFVKSGFTHTAAAAASGATCAVDDSREDHAVKITECIAFCQIGRQERGWSARDTNSFQYPERFEEGASSQAAIVAQLIHILSCCAADFLIKGHWNYSTGDLDAYRQQRSQRRNRSRDRRATRRARKDGKRAGQSGDDCLWRGFGGGHLVCGHSPRQRLGARAFDIVSAVHFARRCALGGARFRIR